ncbi:ParB N-terminal domain-containing protein [Dyadobacter bucti]|uniref:ParB N-terminal domain-containing protein n=1 Tax=Dyadobacter bucti TaxID=2572203 RepID=UPI001107D11F|nr:ParB N-terminal domain-containing protein [Dyadobacter bucti]
MKQTIKIHLLEYNTGQIEGLPANPRFIKDDKYEKLKMSLQEDPEMLELRELLVVPLDKIFVVIAGNMRLRAASELGIKELPCKVIAAGTDPATLRAISIKDNISYGNHDWDMLANEWEVEELEHWGLDIPDLGADEEEAPNTEKILSKKLIIECGDLNELEKLYGELQDRGFVCSLK